jgi:glycosyltransferase involved in cell wall biosynthesis
MNGGGGRPRALFVGGTRYDLPLPPGLARKWDAVETLLELRVIGRAGKVHGEDPRFCLLGHDRRALPGPAFYGSLARVVAAETRSFEPDVVIAQSPFEAFACLLAWRGRARPKLIVELHADWRTAGRLYGSRARRVYARLADRAAVYAMRRADGVRALSRFTAELAKDATGREPVAVFTTYFDLQSFVAEPPKPLPERPAVAWVGVLERYKDPQMLAQAWRTVAARVPDARLVMVGRGPLSRIPEALASELPDQARAEPWLEPPAIARLLDESTLLALSSADGAEGVPRVIMEAFTRGRPVVTTSVGGVPDVVESGVNGLLVEPGDTEGMATALEQVLADRELAGRLADGARSTGQSATWAPDGYARAVREMVDRVLDGAG